MGLYLCVFRGDEEIEGVEVGSYEYWNRFLGEIIRHLEEGKAGLRYPLLTLHSDCDGEWATKDIVELHRNIIDVKEQLEKIPAPWLPTDSPGGDEPRTSSLATAYRDVDGQPIIEGLLRLCEKAMRASEPILFQ